MKTQKRRRGRWGDNDKNFGPFTFAYDRRDKHFAVKLSSTDEEDGGCNFRISGFGLTAIVALPNWLVPPERHKVAAAWDKATIERLGRDWYWHVNRRCYGFSVREGHLYVSYGRETYDSSTEQGRGWFIPWANWRYVRHTLYDIGGCWFAAIAVDARYGTPEYESNERMRDTCPTVAFAFDDFDGARLAATCKLEEREWRLGEGWFKWLSLFAKPKIRRDLDIKFSGETGREKGEWKGGTIGHGIAVEPGELHESAFRRYCAEHEMKFVGRIDVIGGA